MSTKINILLVLLISAIFGSFNIVVCMEGYIPNSTQGFISIIFVILWLLYSFIISYKKVKYCFRFIIWYWTIGLILTLIALFFKWFILIIPLSFVFLTPLYGLRHFFNNAINNKNFFYLAILIIYLTVIFGYFLGKVVRGYSSVKE